MNFSLRIRRQASAHDRARTATYLVHDVTPDMSFLETLDALNEDLTLHGDDPVAFDHDCREGICGACGLVIDGVAHGPQAATATCQLHMRHFRDGATIVVEPFLAGTFPVVKDLVVDRSALDRIIQAGGFITAPTGSAPEANAVLVAKESADAAFDAAACIGCGACVAACPNASATLFVASKVTHLGSLPQGQPERRSRAVRMVRAMDAEGFGACTNVGECSAVCPKGISLTTIAAMNRDVLRAARGA